MFVSILTRLRALLQRRRVARELDDELQFHVAMETEANIKKGMPPAEARRTALRDLGGIEQTKETIRDVRALSIEGIWKDTRYALRSLSTVPGFATVGILTLALGIGANVAIFAHSVVDTVLLRPLPFSEPEQLVAFTASAMPASIWFLRTTSRPSESRWSPGVRSARRIVLERLTSY